MPDFTPEQLRAYLPQNAETGTATWWIGFSGGLDSTVLLHALVALQLPVRLVALHINHQISANANSWQNRCGTFCDQLKVPFHAEKVHITNAGKGIEDAAREARYKVFAEYVGKGDYLFTAHHSNDQAETLLLRLMRGTGPRGLAGIARERQLESGGKLIRPLLHFSRLELEAYASACNLSWVEDESNRDDYYDRNFLRNQVMPLLHSRWPGFMRKWQQTADLCAQQEMLLDEYAQQDLQHADVRAERVGQSLDLSWLKSLSLARRQNLLRYWLRGLQYELPEAVHWQQLETQLFQARADAAVKITWGKHGLQPYRDRLFLLPVELPPMQLQLTEVTAGENQGGKYLRADVADLNIRYRNGGERCKPSGRQHSQTLKKLLQEYLLEPWLRDAVPLLYSGSDLVAVGDLWVCEGFVAPAGAPAIKIDWRAG